MILRKERLANVFLRELVEVDMPFVKMGYSFTPKDYGNAKDYNPIYAYSDELVPQNSLDKAIIEVIEKFAIAPEIIVVGKDYNEDNNLIDGSMFKYFGIVFLYMEDSTTIAIPKNIVDNIFLSDAHAVDYALTVFDKNSFMALKSTKEGDKAATNQIENVSINTEVAKIIKNEYIKVKSQ